MPKMSKNRSASKKNKGKKKATTGRPRGQPPVANPRKTIMSVQKASVPSALRAGKAKHHKTACSILDPFCVHAKGASRPDGASTQALPYQVRFLQNFITDATGASKYVFVPGFGMYIGTGSTITAGVATLGSTWTSTGNANTFLAANAAEIRIVSFGVRAIVTSSSTTASGLLIGGTLSNPIVAQKDVAANIAYPEVEVQGFAAGAELVWYSKPCGTDAHKFVPVSAITNTMTDFNWTALSLEITGGPAGVSGVMQAEVIINLEFTFKMDTAAPTASSQMLTMMAQPAVPANPVAVTTQAAVHSNMPSFFVGPVEKASAYVESKVASVLDDVISTGFALLGL